MTQFRWLRWLVPLLIAALCLAFSLRRRRAPRAGAIRTRRASRAGQYWRLRDRASRASRLGALWPNLAALATDRRAVRRRVSQRRMVVVVAVAARRRSMPACMSSTPACPGTSGCPACCMGSSRARRAHDACRCGKRSVPRSRSASARSSRSSRSSGPYRSPQARRRAGRRRGASIWSRGRRARRARRISVSFGGAHRGYNPAPCRFRRGFYGNLFAT